MTITTLTPNFCQFSNGECITRLQLAAYLQGLGDTWEAAKQQADEMLMSQVAMLEVRDKIYGK